MASRLGAPPLSAAASRRVASDRIMIFLNDLIDRSHRWKKPARPAQRRSSQLLRRRSAGRSARANTDHTHSLVAGGGCGIGMGAPGIFELLFARDVGPFQRATPLGRFTNAWRPLLSDRIG